MELPKAPANSTNAFDFHSFACVLSNWQNENIYIAISLIRKQEYKKRISTEFLRVLGLFSTKIILFGRQKRCHWEKDGVLFFCVLVSSWWNGGWFWRCGIGERLWLECGGMVCLCGVAGRFGLRIIEWFAWWKPVAAERLSSSIMKIDGYAGWIAVRKLESCGYGVWKQPSELLCFRTAAAFVSFF